MQTSKKFIISSLVIMVVAATALVYFVSRPSGSQMSADINNPTPTPALINPALKAPKICMNLSSIAAGEKFVLGINKTDNSLWGWGLNSNGELGNGTTISSTNPVRVSNLSSVKAVSAGDSHAVALKTDGTVWNWGAATSGRLGTGEQMTSDKSTTPIKVASLSNITAVSDGNFHTIVLKNDGTVWAWGLSQYGQITGTADQWPYWKSTPTQVPNLSGIQAIAGGGLHSLALKNDGTVWAWGWNSSGQLGNGTATEAAVPPAQVPGLSNVKAIAAGGGLSMALKTDGTVWVWGDYLYSQFTNGTTTKMPSPVQISGLTGVTYISTGGDISLIVKPDHTVWYFGFFNPNHESESRGINLYQISSLSNIASADTDGISSYALRNDGTLWAWGTNDYGQLGDGTRTDKNYPVQALKCSITPTPTPTAAPE